MPCAKTENTLGTVYLDWRERDQHADLDYIDNVLTMKVDEGCLRLIVMTPYYGTNKKLAGYAPRLRVIPLDLLREVSSDDHIPTSVLLSFVRAYGAEVLKPWGLTIEPKERKVPDPRNKVR